MNIVEDPDVLDTPEQQADRKVKFKEIANEYRPSYTKDTVAVMMQIIGIVPLNGRGKSKEMVFEFMEGKGVAGLEKTLAFQLHTFFNEEVTYTPYRQLGTIECLKFMVDQFNLNMDFDKAQKLTVPCYIPTLKRQIHYLALIEFTPLKYELLKALEVAVWNQYLYEPKNFAQTSFIRLVFGKYFKYWDDIKGNLQNLDPKCSNVTDMLQAVGITKRILIKDHLPDTELSVNQLIPFMRWDERWSEHGYINLEARKIIQYFAHDTPLTSAQKLDVSIWVSNYPKWLKEYTYFDYVHSSEVVKVRIHNHNVLDYLTLPKYNGKVNLKIHPKDWIINNVSDELRSLVKLTYTHLNKTYTLPPIIATRINEHYRPNEVTYLGSGQMLIDEGERMNNCVGGLRYATAMFNGTDHFYHLANSSEDNHGLTIQIDAVGLANPFKMIREVKGYNNRDISDKESGLVTDFLTKVYLADMTINQLRNYYDCK